MPQARIFHCTCFDLPHLSSFITLACHTIQNCMYLSAVPFVKYKFHTLVTVVSYTCHAKELKIAPILDKLLEYKRNWIQHANRMPCNRLPRAMKHYSPTGRRNHGRALKRLLDTWDRNRSTSGPTPWQIYDDDDDDDMPMGLLPKCEVPYLIQCNEYAALRLEIRVSNPEMSEQSALHCFHTRSEAHPASYVLILGVVLGGKAAEYWSGPLNCMWWWGWDLWELHLHWTKCLLT